MENLLIAASGQTKEEEKIQYDLEMKYGKILDFYDRALGEYELSLLEIDDLKTEKGYRILSI